MARIRPRNPATGGSGGLASAVQYASKVASTSVTNTVVLASDPELTLPVTPGTYLLQSCLIYNATTTADFRFSFLTPAGATFSIAPNCLSVSATSVSSATMTRQLYTQANAYIVTGGVGADAVASPEGLVTVTTSGSITVRFCQSAAEATDATLQAGSWLALTKVA